MSAPDRRVIAALREERARLVRIATELGAWGALAAVGFIRCAARHSGTDERCLLGEGHGGPSPGYVGHQSERVTWLETAKVSAADRSKPCVGFSRGRRVVSAHHDWRKGVRTESSQLWVCQRCGQAKQVSK